MILTPGYRRSVPPALAQKIAQAAQDGGAEAVGVFVSESPEQIDAVCDTVGLKVVQSYRFGLLLPSHLKRILVNAPGVPLRQEEDFLLLESGHPGSGTPIEETRLRSVLDDHPSCRFILAGGLTPGNVQEMIRLYQPLGVDVSSGVEENGQKSCVLIQEFIEKVRAYG
jgi:phosphoribosylanthranilate isomerase